MLRSASSNCPYILAGVARMGSDGEGRSALQMDAEQLWETVLGELQVRLSRTAFDNWLRQTALIGFDEDFATVGAANTFSVSTLQGRYAPQVERALSEVVGRPVAVRFAVLGTEGGSSDVADGGEDGEDRPRSLFGGPIRRPARGPARGRTDEANGRRAAPVARPRAARPSASGEGA
ncbi:MAG: hypothetical protein M3Q10_06305, partial [Chloroflexota bacterium]|nr:hypothetical protein [Chloroflexota bacterium]